MGTSPLPWAAIDKFSLIFNLNFLWPNLKPFLLLLHRYAPGIVYEDAYKAKICLCAARNN